MTITEINTAIARYFTAMFPLWSTVIGLQNQPKISDKQISFYIERFRAVGTDVWISASETTTETTMRGIRDVWLSVMITGDGAMQTSWDFTDKLQMEENPDIVRELGFESIDADTPTQIPYLQGTKYIERCEFPWRIRINTEYGNDAGRIESGTIDGKVNENVVSIDYQK